MFNFLTVKRRYIFKSSIDYSFVQLGWAGLTLAKDCKGGSPDRGKEGARKEWSQILGVQCKTNCPPVLSTKSPWIGGLTMIKLRIHSWLPSWLLLGFPENGFHVYLSLFTWKSALCLPRFFPPGMLRNGISDIETKSPRRVLTTPIAFPWINGGRYYPWCGNCLRGEFQQCPLLKTWLLTLVSQFFSRGREMSDLMDLLFC